MAKKQVATKEQKIEVGPSRRRQSLRDSLQSVAKAQEKELSQYSRQVDYDSLFDAFEKEACGGTVILLKPPYLPGKMYELAEQSSKLSACIQAYIDNVDGYGYDITSGVSDDDNIQSENNPMVQELRDFFDQPNDVDTFRLIRERLRRDLETTGNAFLEVIRDMEGKPVMMFWVDAKRVRISVTRDPVIQTVYVNRKGQEIPVQAEKRYRSYCMLTSEGSATGPRARYFKQFGDTRVMEATTGELFPEGTEVRMPASEIIHFKLGNDVYGVPRWIGALLSVMGSWKSNLVNYDLFDNQGIPPMIVTVTGGMLTDDSYADLVSLFRKAKGARNFSKLLVLEAEGTGGSLDGKETAPALDIKNMTEYRKEDAMFLNYMEHCNVDIQKNGFRLPGMFLGQSDDANYATAFIVRRTAEEQLFIPERERFDEVINTTLVRSFGAKDLQFKSNGPVLQSTENISQLISLLVQNGAFTVNGLISFVNEHFGTAIALYEGESWADEPINGGEPELQSIAIEAQPVDEEPEEAQDLDQEALDAVQKSQKTQKALEALSNVFKQYANIPCQCH